MDATKPFKVVKVPTAWGVVEGVQGEVLYEAESLSTAQALLYGEQVANILYSLEVVEFHEEVL